MTREEIGEAIRRARTRQRKTQMAAGEACMITQTHLSQIERGKMDAQLGTILRIMAALRLRLKCGSVEILKASDLYGVIGSTMLRRGWGNRELSEASGVSLFTLYKWHGYNFEGVQITNILRILDALFLPTVIIELG